MSGLVSLDSLRRFTREDSAGIFEDEYQVELFDGYVVTSAAPVGGAHGWAVSNLAKLFVQSVDSPDLRIHLHGSISLSEYGVLQSGFAIFRRIQERDRQNPTADQIILVIEVADTSLRTDLTDKMQLYAEAGIPVYWVVDVRHKLVSVYTQPEDGIYSHIEQFSTEQNLHVCGRDLAVGDILK